MERQSTRKNLSVEEYKDARDEMLGNIEQEKEAIIAEVEPLRELKTGIDEIAGTGKTVLPGVVAIKKTLKRSRSRRKPTPPIETKSKRCESVRLLSPKGSSVPISESSS